MGLVPGVAGILLDLSPFATLENTGLDLLFRMRGVQAAPQGVCVVAIDDDSYREMGVPALAPWPRTLQARLIRKLSQEGARAIAFDVTFNSTRDKSEDRDLAAAIAESGHVVLGSEINRTTDPHGTVVTVEDPIEPFKRAAAAVGVVGLKADDDNFIRWAWPRFPEPGGGVKPSLAFGAYRVATNDRSALPMEPRLIDYYGPARTVPTVSFYQAVEPQTYLRPGFFRDRIVFVGLSQPAATGQAPKDAFPTPFFRGDNQPTYGVEIHATIAANLLEGRRIDILPGAAEALLVLILPLLSMFTFMYLRPGKGALCLVLLEALPWTAGHLAFSYGHVSIPVMIPAVVQVPGAYVISLIWYYMTTVRERERIRRAFSFYLSPDMIAKIVADPASLNLGGEEIVATAMFTDIKGFTTLAEGMGAKETALLLNQYFSEVNRRIFAEGGTLIKFIGDAVFAIWGAPLRLEDHATPACAAALALARAQTTEAGEDASTMQKLVTRIGVNTGYMLVGNLGSEQRFDYTAIGDAVNVAARLEGLNKYLGTRVIASGTAVLLTGSKFVTRRLGLAGVAGRGEPVEIFEILGMQGDTTTPEAGAVARFEAAVGDYTAGRLEKAAEGFRKVLEMCGGKDGPSEYYLKTIERFTKAPPASWDGVLSFEK
jgi:adenylate cyclase